MDWIGLTGGIASGKSTVSHLLRSRGFSVIDADLLARDAVQIGTDGHREIVQAFGPGVVSTSGEIDRKTLGEQVFRDRTRLAVLEGILHPKIRLLAQAKREELRKAGHAHAFYDVPLLFEKKMASLFDRVVAVVCSRKMQLERMILRDGMSPLDAERRLAAQMPIEEKAALADDVIRNEGTLAELEKAVDTYVDLLHHAKT
jgi:dephospho-CoA kinase